ncbi:hypothetical protein Back2_22890 [Nocardioides baekrokdamisoli]|uniref:Retropepsin-like aspartic endopeptidase domain-containing protein n=1 Tax=Nocardioides baekrokdamisoli TaxID=1804624 RepID=A0A3G9IIL3_9ACTN|nr:hypothetical protein Back2_22890 [Nocardioides baekrokdamisoli]
MSALHSTTPGRLVVGWREWVGLPQIPVPWMKAKIDTGARTSALHAFGIEPFERDGAPWVRFSVHPWQRSALDTTGVERPVHDVRHVRSSSGHAQERYVVLLDLRILDQVVTAEVTLTHRDAMGFRMLIGREALRGRFVVDSARSYRGGRPEQETRDRNRGRHGA